MEIHIHLQGLKTGGDNQGWMGLLTFNLNNRSERSNFCTHLLWVQMHIPYFFRHPLFLDLQSVHLDKENNVPLCSTPVCMCSMTLWWHWHTNKWIKSVMYHSHSWSACVYDVANEPKSHGPFLTSSDSIFQQTCCIFHSMLMQSFGKLKYRGQNLWVLLADAVLW